MRYAVIFLLLIFSGCVTQTPTANIPIKTRPEYPIDPKPERMLLLNTYDVDSKKFRKNKKELFKRFIDSMLITCKTELHKRLSIQSEIIPGFTNISTLAHDSIYMLMNEHHATHAIVINSFDVGFDQTHVEVEKSGNSKSREAFYDITSDISFSFYSGQSLFKELHMSKNDHFDSRPVASGLLAVGPNIVLNEKHAWDITRSNLNDYLNLFFPGVIYAKPFKF